MIGDAGLIFRENDAARLRRHLLRLQQQPELRRELGLRGRQRVLERYTQVQVAEHTVQAYRDALRSA